jgi:hypothetical protein
MNIYESFLQRIKDSGRPQTWYAKHMDVDPNLLNRWLHERDKMPDHRKNQLEKLLL